MADDSKNVEAQKDFHSCDIPHGMNPYVLEDLSPDQQDELNIRKTQVIRESQTYLEAHPEIRGLIIMILRTVLRSKDHRNIYETIGRYFARSSTDIKEEVYAYLAEREKILSPNSVIVSPRTVESVPEEQELVPEEEPTTERAEEAEVAEIEEEQIQEEEEEEHDSETSLVKECKRMLDRILETVFEEDEEQDVAAPHLLPVEFDLVLNAGSPESAQSLQ